MPLVEPKNPRTTELSREKHGTRTGAMQFKGPRTELMNESMKPMLGLNAWRRTTNSRLCD